ncbi:C4b-binding protein alpha chain-like [Fundulus diaphanus]
MAGIYVCPDKRVRFHRVTAPDPAMGVAALFLLSSLCLFAVTAQGKNCGTLGEVANGDVTYINGTEFGDTAKVTFGSAVIRCGVEGWTARLPTCEVVKCVKPGGIVNGTFSPVKEFYDYREVVQYSCNKDLELNGSRELTCSENGNFSPAPPTCVWVECKDPVIENGQYESGSRPPHRLNAALTYSCKTGYTMEGPSTVTCNLTSQWFPSLPKCNTQQCSKPSGGPNMDLKPAYILNTTFEDGATVAFSCSPGYTPAGGSTRITCTAGQWSAVLLRCERKTCGALTEVTNGEVIYTDGNEFGDTARVQCKAGYFPVGGSPVLRCDVEGWTGRLQTCEVLQCVTPGRIVNGAFSPEKDSYEYREVVRYSCNKDLVLNGSRELTCSEDGNFSPAPPTCVWVECKDPVIENGQYESGSRPPHRHQAVVTYSCKTGYKMEGPSTVTCNLTSQWFPSLPKCNMVKCATPGGIVNGTFSPVKDSYDYRDVVQYSCSKDLVLKGSRELTCSEDGNFSPAPPTCVSQQCSKPSGGPNMHLKPEYITQTTFADGATVAFSCNPGYTPAGGSTRITCTAGQWSAVQLRCEKKNCGALPEVTNGEIIYTDGTEFGDTAKVQCKPGLVANINFSVLRCGVEGWMGRLPTCEVMKCVTPGGIVNGTFSPEKDSYDYRDVVQYSCNKDFVLNGSKELTCSGNEKFSPAPPTCVWVECKDPVIENGQYESGSRPPHRHNSALTYSCKTGYTTEGPSTVTCNLTSQWFPSLPKCKKVAKPTPPTTTSTTATPTGHGDSLSPGIIVLIVLAIIIPICAICVYIYRKKRKHHGPVDAKLQHVKVSSGEEDSSLAHSENLHVSK